MGTYVKNKKIFGRCMVKSQRCKEKLLQDQQEPEFSMLHNARTTCAMFGYDDYR